MMKRDLSIRLFKSTVQSIVYIIYRLSYKKLSINRIIRHTNRTKTGLNYISKFVFIKILNLIKIQDISYPCPCDNKNKSKTKQSSGSILYYQDDKIYLNR